MTRDEALAKWSHCRQVSRWKDNFAPDENDGTLARKLSPLAFENAVITQVATPGMWPSAQYAAVVKVEYAKGSVLYLAVRKEG